MADSQTFMSEFQPQTQVGAIVVYDQAAREARLELQALGHRELAPEALNEEVFLAQLHRRALLLNPGFQDAVKHIVLRNAVEAEGAVVEPLDWDLHENTATGVINEVAGRPPSLSSSLAKAPSGSVDTLSWWSRRASASLVMETPSLLTSAVSSRTGSVWKHRGTLKAGSEVLPLRCSSASAESTGHGVHIMCAFQSGAAGVEVLTAPVKTLARMREKVLEYAAEAVGGWPQSARIVDPIRASIVCNGPAQILEAFLWFSQGLDGRPRVPICRVKNRFSFDKGEIMGGCGPCDRDTSRRNGHDHERK
jgi:hypothetical protein